MVWGNCLDIIFDEVIRLILDHFIQPDAIVPGMFNPQNLSRYSYVRNNPILYTDPSGHVIYLDGIYCGTPTNPSYQNYAPPSSTTGGQHHEATYNPENLGGNGDVPALDGIINGKGPGLNALSQQDSECDGSGLITQYCLNMDAGSAQELEDFLDNVNASLNLVSALESSAALAIMIREYLRLPTPQQVTVLVALMAVSPPAAIALGVLGLESQLIGNDLNNISENLSDSNITDTGGTLTISSNIFL